MFALIAVAMVWSTTRWIMGLCAVIVLAAVAQHEDMPQPVGTGLNVANLVLFWTLCMWFVQRRPAELQPRIPASVIWVGLGYLFILVLAYARGVSDLGSMQGEHRYWPIATAKVFTVEYLINPLKSLLPAGLVFLGVWTRRESKLVLGSLLIMAGLLCIVVLRNLPLNTLLDEALYMARRLRIQRQTGMHANDVSLIMVQAFWGVMLYARHVRGRYLKLGLWAASAAFMLAVALCHSRAGYAAFVGTGLVVGVLCWRRLLWAFLPTLFAAVMLVPTIRNRVFTGFDKATPGGQTQNDWNEITAGRTSVLWPAAWEQFERAPVFGKGRLTIMRSPMYEPCSKCEGICPSHPHNAYLEMLIDGGVFSMGILLSVGILLLRMALKLTRQGDPELRATGGVFLAALTALAAMGVSGQSFWPHENTMPTFVVAALGVRVWMLRRAAGALDHHAVS